MDAMTTMIRKATPNDIPALVALWRQMWDFHLRLDRRYELTAIAEEVMAKWFEENMRNSRVLLLMAEDPTPVGYVHAMIMENPPTVPHVYYGYISELAVVDDRRRKGVGTLLVQSAHDWFKQNNITMAEVNVSVRNAISQSFWRRCGYTDYLERLRTDLNGPEADR